MLNAVLLSILACQDPGAATDKLFAAFTRPGNPGAAVAVIDHGKIVHSKGYGLANLEYGIKITPQTVFHVASVSKQFTAFATVLLESRGKLSIDDDVRKHLPLVPDFGPKITLRHLLWHTSGLRDQWELCAMSGTRLDDVISTEHILALVGRQKELNFPPGAVSLYCNTGYTLLAQVVARVSGQRFEDFTKHEIFEPLGMTRSHFHSDHRHIVTHRAYSYARNKNGWQKSVLSYANCGATSLFTTAEDLCRWIANFGSATAGGKRVIARMQERRRLASGKTEDYGLGISLGRRGKLALFEHGGADAGFRSHVLWFPAKSLGVAVVGNRADCPAGAACHRVAQIWLGGKLRGVRGRRRPAQPRTREARGAGSLAEYAGSYYSSEIDTTYTLVRDGKRLVARHIRNGTIPLQPIAKDRFAGNRWFFRAVGFSRDPAGRISGFRLTGSRVRNLRFVRR